MKTNQTLTRKMGDFEVFQRTSDQMFNATQLLSQWNKSNNAAKKIAHYFDNSSTQEFISTIKSKEFSDVGIPTSADYKGVYIKSKGGKEKGATWMHPMLFIDFAMWINPSFKYDVLRFVYDQLIQYRNEAGDTYREMSSQIARISAKKEEAQNIQNVAKAINHIVYGTHEREIRNKRAEEESMKELASLQTKVTMLIKEGFISSYPFLIEYLRNQWKMKHQPKELF